MSEVVEDGQTLMPGDGLVTATFHDPHGGTGKVLLAKYVGGYQPEGTAIAIGGVVYEVHFAPTSTTSTDATLTVSFVGLAPLKPLLHCDSATWEPINSDDRSAVRTDSASSATVVSGPNSTPTLIGLDGTQITTPPLVLPAAADECGNGGWYNLTRADGTAFMNQGDCVQYVNTGR